ncbi:hypothetical protein HOLleu_33446 [Holothuria leucospilota]|uniref:Uncharacterized protein n=1 Tax=Holothuria leucospilota TaxID=206669 RepID=A0A9Q0YNN7_HOLLE|nr:hypothetical protein HOLleu_33446 [Holothuria leucospilota]
MDPFTPKSRFEKRFAGNAAGPASIDLRLIQSGNRAIFVRRTIVAGHTIGFLAHRCLDFSLCCADCRA